MDIPEMKKNGLSGKNNKWLVAFESKWGENM